MSDTTIQLTTYPSQMTHGSLSMPGDKSMSHRAVLLGAISQGITRVTNFLPSGDCLHTVQAMRQLGVRVEQQDTQVTVHGVGLYGLKPSVEPIDCGNAGTLVRLLMGILAGQPFSTQLIGDHSLSQRPMERVMEPLEYMGASFQEHAKKGCLPLTIQGHSPLKGIDYISKVASAQVKSCIMLAGLYALELTSVTEPELSRDHTERMLQAFGGSVAIGKKITLYPKPLKGCSFAIPGDFSSAAFFIVAACLMPDAQLRLTQVGLNPTRTGLLTCLQQMGADITVKTHEGFEVTGDITIKSSALKGIDIPESLVVSTIDEFPILFIAAAFATGTTRLRNARELRVKESDRLTVMADHLSACGVNVEIYEDGIDIEGGGFQGGTVDSFGDHRIAMAFAVAGWVANQPVVVNQAQSIETSFPSFLECAQALGLNYTIQS